MYNIDDIRAILKNKLSEKRYEHTLGVEYTAAALAMRYGADMNKARVAGLLHDCAKYFPGEKLLAKCRKHHLEINQYEQDYPELLHAKVGAYLASSKYGVQDEEILSAITWHTTGRPDMTLLDKIIYIADYIEPNRNKAPDLDEIRELAFKDLDECLMTILSHTLSYLKEKGSVIDPTTFATYEYYRR
ncbi:MAG: bis(5'-nucleosyl)-tetraphosphatase (symmetrical) YqeK [Lachnospiraceae bacterium]|nr:bis(5'-nucleosyl)-tetraphosphatase (symmetrical) YqeK [Lachnospiraceae bacterium]